MSDRKKALEQIRDRSRKRTEQYDIPEVPELFKDELNDGDCSDSQQSDMDFIEGDLYVESDDLCYGETGNEDPLPRKKSRKVTNKTEGQDDSKSTRKRKKPENRDDYIAENNIKISKTDDNPELQSITTLFRKIPQNLIPKKVKPITVDVAADLDALMAEFDTRGHEVSVDHSSPSLNPKRGLGSTLVHENHLETANKEQNHNYKSGDLLTKATLATNVINVLSPKRTEPARPEETGKHDEMGHEDSLPLTDGEIQSNDIEMQEHEMDNTMTTVGESEQNENLVIDPESSSIQKTITMERFYVFDVLETFSVKGVSRTPSIILFGYSKSSESDDHGNVPTSVVVHNVPIVFYIVPRKQSHSSDITPADKDACDEAKIEIQKKIPSSLLSHLIYEVVQKGYTHRYCVSRKKESNRTQSDLLSDSSNCENICMLKVSYNPLLTASMVSNNRGTRDSHSCLALLFPSGIPRRGESFVEFIEVPSITEYFFLSRHLKGPSWISLTPMCDTGSGESISILGETHSRYSRSTRYSREVHISIPESISVIKGASTQLENVCPLSVMSIQVKNFVFSRHPHDKTTKGIEFVQEISAISIRYTSNVDLAISIDNLLSLPAESWTGISIPPSLEKRIGREKSLILVEELQKHGVEVDSSEKVLLNHFIALFSRFNPDIVIGHDISSNILGTLLNRLNFYGIKGLDRLGRLNRNSNTGVASNLFAGRLICDTSILSREYYKSATYDLTTLCASMLGIDRSEVAVSSVDKRMHRLNEIQGVNNLESTISQSIHGSREGADTNIDPTISSELPSNNQSHEFYTTFKALHEEVSMDVIHHLRITWYLNVLPLTRELSCLSGCSWNSCLQNRRAERNDSLLAFEFHEKNYVFPSCPIDYSDKTTLQCDYTTEMPHNFTGFDMNDTDEPVKPLKGKKKAAYTGGLVLEPKSGLYENHILVLDFDSLYPSIIREFDICFTTLCSTDESLMESIVTERHNNMMIDNLTRNSRDSSNLVLLNGVLPSLASKLIESRKHVKRLLKDAILPSPDPNQNHTNRQIEHKNNNFKHEYQQLEIRQQALKLLANSMYGCLGFTGSRFYAPHLASLITKLGRNVLSKAVEVATDMGLDVIYGDTDSIFVNSLSNVYTEALKTSYNIISKINSEHHILNISCDAVFKKLLLLRKKKYAGLKIVSPNKNTHTLDNTSTPTCDRTGRILGIERELKGLDMVRRDWCPLSKRVCDETLNIVLGFGTYSGKIPDADTAISTLHDYLTHIGHVLDARAIHISEFVITKSLTKNLEDYVVGNTLPHVAVAMQMKRIGLTIKRGMEVRYVMCTKSAISSVGVDCSSSGEGADGCEPVLYTDSSVKDNSLLGKIDIRWYKVKQIHPAVVRLCATETGTSPERIADCLGLDGSVYNNSAKMSLCEMNEINSVNDWQHSSESIGEKWVNNKSFSCYGCQKGIHLLRLVRRESCECGLITPDSVVRNLLRLTITEIVRDAFSHRVECEEGCDLSIDEVPMGTDRCIRCEGNLLRGTILGNKAVYYTLEFLQNFCKSYNEDTVLLIQEYMDSSVYGTVDLSLVFSVFSRLQNSERNYTS